MNHRGTELRRIGAVAWKDLTAERRTKATFNAVAFVAVLTLLLFGFALGPDTAALSEAAAGMIWLTILFSGVLAFNRSYQLELEAGALEALLLYPGDRRSIFLGKLLANLAFVFLVELLILPAAAALYHVPLAAGGGRLVLVVASGTLGFVTLGTFYAALASRVRAREVLLPLLLFPMLSPLLVAATEATAALLQGDPLGRAGAWLRLLVAFDVIFLTACFLGFEYVLEE